MLFLIISIFAATLPESKGKPPKKSWWDKTPTATRNGLVGLIISNNQNNNNQNSEWNDDDEFDIKQFISNFKQRDSDTSAFDRTHSMFSELEQQDVFLQHSQSKVQQDTTRLIREFEATNDPALVPEINRNIAISDKIEKRIQSLEAAATQLQQLQRQRQQ